MVIVGVIVAVLLAGFGGLMAAVESAMSSVSRTDVRELSESNRFNRSLRAIAEDARAHANAVSFARTVAETTGAVVVTLIFVFTLNMLWVVLVVSALVMTAVSFVLVGASPRSVGKAHAAMILRFTAPLVHFIRLLLGPIAKFLVAFGDRVTPGRTRDLSFASEKQLLNMVDEAAEMNVLEEDDRLLIHSVFNFTEAIVRGIMVPRTDMITLDAHAHIGTSLARFLHAGVSRIPVVDGEIDNVVGILYVRDVAKLYYERPATIDEMSVRHLVRPALFVPESMKGDTLLRKMQRESNHLAMVVDEYGGIAGLVTLEDLIEELVGEISDEYDHEIVEVELLDDHRYRVNVRLSLDALGDLFGIHIDDEEVDSVGGLFAKALGRLPVPGSVVHTNGLIFTGERIEGPHKRLSTVIVEPEKTTISEAPTSHKHEDSNG